RTEAIQPIRRVRTSSRLVSLRCAIRTVPRTEPRPFHRRTGLALRPCWSVETRSKESLSSRGRAAREHVARSDSTHRDGELAVEHERPRARRLLTDRGRLGGDRLLECGQHVIALHPGPRATVLDTLREPLEERRRVLADMACRGSP